MSLIWAESFDHYGTTPNGGRDAMLAGAWAEFVVGTTLAVSPLQARTGTNSLRIIVAANSSQGARRVLGSGRMAVGVAQGLYMPSLPAASLQHSILTFRNGLNASIARLLAHSDGSIALIAKEVNIVVSNPCLLAGTWNHVEAKLIVDPIVGSVEVRVNGVVVINVTNIDTAASACTQLWWGKSAFPVSALNSSYEFFLDDIVAWDTAGTVNNDFLGAQRVSTVFCDADTAVASWTKTGSATGWEAIDDTTPDGDTTYIEAAAIGDKSEFELPALPEDIATVTGIYIPIYAKLAAAGAGSMQASLLSGAGVGAGAVKALTTTYSYGSDIYEINPVSAVKWTKTEFEAGKLRLEKIS